MTKNTTFRSNSLISGVVVSLFVTSTSAFAQSAPGTPPDAPQATPGRDAEVAATLQPEEKTSAVPQSTPGTVAESAATPAAPVPAGEQPKEGATKPAESEKKAELPSKLAVGEGGGLKLSGVVQVWGVYQNQTDIDAPSDHASTARLRRAELKVSGDLVPKKFGFGVMLDVAKTPKFGSATVVTPPKEGETEPGTADVLTPAKDNSLLQDAYITYSTGWFDVSAGQFKTPISYESATSSSKLILPERAAVVRAYGEQRDVGIKLEKKSDYVGFVFGAFNGAGMNRLDDNNQKDLALRLEAYPVKALTLAAVGYTSVGQRGKEESTKDRLEGDIALDLGELHLQAEYIHAWSGPKGERLEGAGWYGVLGYTIGKLIQPVVRVGQLDTDVDTEDDALTTVEAGVNYFAYKDIVKVQLAYAHTGYEAAGKDPLSEVVLAGQFKY
jgi:hypothetical protein